MAGDKWTFLLFGDQGEEIRQFSLSKQFVYRAAGGAGFFCVSLIAVASFFVLGGGNSLRTLQLERTNSVLVQEMQMLRERLGSVQDELEGLAERDAELRVLAGLDVIDPEVQQVGVGGPGSPEPSDHPLYGIDEALGKEAFAAAYDLRALERRARLLRESMSEAADSLHAHRDLLESTPSILPTIGRMTSGFSAARAHPIHNRALPHEGIDLSAPRGTPIMSAARGTVTFAGRRSGYGLVVEIDHGYGLSTLYGHASELLVRPGQQVTRGEMIARVGSTGIATSPHLHYEVHVGGRPVNPMNYVISGAVP
jgi:murein DD-endopeptidase MepM/ murein hydrolase activator NlpD